MPMMTERGLTTRAVCRESGLSYRVLDYWVRTGVIVPSIAEGEGPGTTRRWSEEDVEIVLVLAQVWRVVNSTDRLAQLTDQLRAGVERLAVLADGRLVVDPGWWDLGTAALVIQR